MSREHLEEQIKLGMRYIHREGDPITMEEVRESWGRAFGRKIVELSDKMPLVTPKENGTSTEYTIQFYVVTVDRMKELLEIEKEKQNVDQQ